MLQADEGYFFGIGAFETIAVMDGRPVLLEPHLQRLQRAVDFLKLPVALEAVRTQVAEALQQQELQDGHKVLKVVVSEKNIVIRVRENPYKETDYEKGFLTELSSVVRNETSDFTYHKTLNYGDCLFEKRKAKACGIDEPIFRNTRGELCEGAVSNVFFVKNGKLYTPPVKCGLLPGILREHIIENYAVEERIIFPREVESFDEMFVTNSLMGIMPVKSFDGHAFVSREVADRLRGEYRKNYIPPKIFP